MSPACRWQGWAGAGCGAEPQALRAHSPGGTFTASGDRAGKHIIDAFSDKGGQVSLQLSWGFNYMVKLQPLPLKTNCMFSLIVFL